VKLLESKKPNKDEAFEALDFIINVLKEHEKDLDRLVSELGKIAGKSGQLGEVSSKIERVEARLSSIHGGVASLAKDLSLPKESVSHTRGPSVIVRCTQWDDFKVVAKGAESVCFLLLFKETEKSLEANALKDGRVFAYKGGFPSEAKLLKFWLARELSVAEDCVFEGVLATG
jgi:hypothetical protein